MYPLGDGLMLNCLQNTNQCLQSAQWHYWHQLPVVSIWKMNLEIPNQNHRWIAIQTSPELLKSVIYQSKLSNLIPNVEIFVIHLNSNFICSIYLTLDISNITLDISNILNILLMFMYFHRKTFLGSFCFIQKACIHVLNSVLIPYTIHSCITAQVKLKVLKVALEIESQNDCSTLPLMVK